MVYRIFVEKKEPYAVECAQILQDLKDNLGLRSLVKLRMINRYDVEGVDQKIFEAAKRTIFSEPQTDVIYDELHEDDPTCRILASESLPGQFDQRADSCAQCIQILSQQARPDVRTAKLYLLYGVTDQEFEAAANYLINPVECRRAALDLPDTLMLQYDAPSPVETLSGFCKLTKEQLADFLAERGLAMDLDDLLFLQRYFNSEERRDPTITELRVIDTYWSDHCRHTTFSTCIDEVSINEECVKLAFEDYLAKREAVYGKNCVDRKITLMDLATLGAKYLKKEGLLTGLDESDEINACSVKVKARIDGNEEDWVLMFKNETHNHPTEIEPFGGAATCLGGAIRDPLSGRSYVYQAMRVTGAADPTRPISETLPGKLPQAKITKGAAAGYSAYGNQIGLATGSVTEFYHPGYEAKRLEIGAVVGAAPASHIRREPPAPGDAVILIGGRTGRDGCGGATGSSKAHSKDSLATCGAEVQKGNPPEERKIQRLFRKKEVTTLIKRCNDFGAGGVSVAVGELADGLTIDLGKIKKKYEGLDATELAISESQERMAVVVVQADADRFIQLAAEENLEAETIACVTAEARLKMTLDGKVIVDLSRKFLDSNGAEKHAAVAVNACEKSIFDGLSHKVSEKESMLESFSKVLSDLNVCSQKGLVERFDSTIGAASVVLPFGGRTQRSPGEYMAAKLPCLSGDCETASVMSFGFQPYVSEKSPFHGALYAVVESLAKLCAAGVRLSDCYLTLQEYFPRPDRDPVRLGLPFAALLGALRAQCGLGVGAIGGKDSMSGSFERRDVPPTLVSFAVATHDANRLVTCEFKKPGSKVYLLKPQYDRDQLPNFADLKGMYLYLNRLCSQGKILSARVLSAGGIGEAVFKLCIGNEIGFAFDPAPSHQALFSYYPGAIVVETSEPIQGEYLGTTLEDPILAFKDETIPLSALADAYEKPLEPVFPTRIERPEGKTELVQMPDFTVRPHAVSVEKFLHPRVLIPVFPGTNCEYDTARQFDAAGGVSDILVFRNLTPIALTESLDLLVERIRSSQIVVLPGGFSGGDEPDGSGKFITAVFRNPRVRLAMTELLEERDGLVLGICNGFQALIKLGLLPHGKILDEMSPDSPTLTYNTLGRHQSMMVTTRISSVRSPWLAGVSVGDLHTVAVSHGEGRLCADTPLLQALFQNGQVATQYADPNGNPTMALPYNPNGSAMAIEGLLSPDGRIFGKMGHSERIGPGVAINVPGEKDQKIFASGVNYFR